MIAILAAAAITGWLSFALEVWANMRPDLDALAEGRCGR